MVPGRVLGRLSKLKPHSKNFGWLVVDFNAWQHQRISLPWWSFIDAIYRQTLKDLRKERPFAFLRIIISETMWRAKFRRSKLFLIVTIALLFLAIILFSGIDFSNIKGLSEAGKKFTDLAQNVSGIIAVMGSVVSGILLLQSFLLPTAKKDPSELFKSFDDPMREISLHFAQFTKRTNKIKLPIVVFIDDLDRCSEKYTVEFLEGIQTIFREGSIVYVVAADKRWIQIAYEKAYDIFSDIGEPARPLGQLFLSKIFQMSIPLPTLSTTLREKFLRTLLKTASVEDKADQKQIVEEVKKEIDLHKDTDSIAKWAITKKGNPIYVQTARDAAIRKLEDGKYELETENMLQKFHHLLEPNPRAIKRLLNTFVMYRAILIMQGIDLDFEVLALWIILMMRWPLLSEYISRNPKLINHLSDDRLSDFPDMPEKFKLLLHNEDFRHVLGGYRIGKKLDEKAIGQIAEL